MKLAIIFFIFLVSSSEILAYKSITVYKHRSVNQRVGPVNAIYCRMFDPKENIVFSDFGNCNLVIDRVSMEHSGRWRMSVGLPGRILLEDETLRVTVLEKANKTEVITNVRREQPELIISCSVSSPYPIKGCKFRDANGRILLAAPGVAQDRYVYYGTNESIEIGSPHVCGLRIIDPETMDLGLWRCAMETDYETYYGFFPVFCSYALESPGVHADVKSDPVLTAERTSNKVQEGDSVIMSFYIQAPIRYCYFRHQNGTTFSVTPSTSTPDMEYVGAGFDSGECGVRFHNFLATDSGSWSCTVGLHGNTEKEYRDFINIYLNPLMTVSQFVEYGHIYLDVKIHAAGDLEYCRYVPLHEYGFTSLRVPNDYLFVGSLSRKDCSLRIYRYYEYWTDRQPFAIAAKIVGQDEEIMRTITLERLEYIILYETSDLWYLWLLIPLAVLLAVLGVACGPKKNRQWTLARATTVKNCLKHRIRKNLLPAQAEKTTPPPYSTLEPEQNV